MSAPVKTPLISDNLFEGFQIVEKAEAGKRLKAKGIFGVVGEATKNGRRYPEAVWEKQLARLKPAIDARRVCGMLDHPDDGKQRTEKFSHLLTSLSMVEEGKRKVIVGEFEVLSTTAGKELASLIADNVNLGVSSRGFGTVKELSDGTTEVNEDYRLVTFDVVSDPAVGIAYPNYFREEDEYAFDANELPESEGGKGQPKPIVETAPTKKPKTESKAKPEPEKPMTVEAVQALVAAHILEDFRTIRDEALAEAKKVKPKPTNEAELSGLQAQVAGLTSERDVLSRKLQESEAARATLDEEAAKAISGAAIALRVEKALVGLSESKVVSAREFLGDTSKYTTLDEVDARLKTWAEKNHPLGAPDVSERVRELETKLAEAKAVLATSRTETERLASELKAVESVALSNKAIAEKALLALETEQAVVKMAARPELVGEARRRLQGAATPTGIKMISESTLFTRVDPKLAERARRSFPRQIGESTPSGGTEVVEDDLGGTGMSVDEIARAIRAMPQ